MKNKKIIFLIGGIIFLAIILIYSLKSPRGDTNGVNLVDSSVDSGLLGSNNGKSSESEEIVEVLSMLNKVNLKPDFFEDAVFLGLEDFSVQLVEGEMGRNNPFAAY